MKPLPNKVFFAFRLWKDRLWMDVYMLEAGEDEDEEGYDLSQLYDMTLYDRIEIFYN